MHSFIARHHFSLPLHIFSFLSCLSFHIANDAKNYLHLTKYPQFFKCGGGGIRTHEAREGRGFQDRSDRPLRHSSDIIINT